MLKRYRRHTKTCSKGYSQNYRVFEPRTQKERSMDCHCPIAAEGQLRTHGRVTNKSTGQTDWAEALEVTRQWEQWGQLTEPQPEFGDNPPIAAAIDAFLKTMGPSGKDLAPSTLSGYRSLFFRRMLPWCEVHRYRMIREFDSSWVVEQFFLSWVQLENRKNTKFDNKPLNDRTKRAEVDRLRSFLKYCVNKEWIKKNQAEALRVVVISEPRYGMEESEESAVFAEIDKCDERLQAFARVMRYAGLRISDACMLCSNEIHKSVSGKGWVIRYKSIKTGVHTVVPIPPSLIERLQVLPVLFERHGNKYWFWDGKIALKSSTIVWRQAIMKPIREADKALPGGFTHQVTPHSFRHSFSIRNLNANVPLKVVSRWLGHTSVKTTEQHYGHAIASTEIAAEAEFERAMAMQHAY